MRELSDELKRRKDAVFRIIRISHKHRQIMEKKLETTGVFHSQHRLLMEISLKPNQSQKELADNMKISTASIAVSLKKLEKGGYIERSIASEDSRFNNVEITPKGREVVEKSIEIFDIMDNKMFEGLSEKEIEQFSTIMDRILKNMEGEE